MREPGSDYVVYLDTSSLLSREEAYWSHPVCLSLRVETVDLRSRHGAFV